MISGGAVLAVALYFQVASGATAESIGHVVEALQRWRRLISGFGPQWGSLLLGIGIIALGVYAHRRGKISMMRAFEAVRDRELERLGDEARDGRWEDLPPSSDMRAVAAHAEDLLKRLDQIRNFVAAGIPDAVQAQQEIFEEIERMKKLHFQLDVQRRLDLRLSPEEASLPSPQTRWERVQTFFISRGLWGALKRPARVAYLCNLALLIPSLLGVYSLPASVVFEQRFVRLAELQVELSHKEALAAWQQFRAVPGPPEEDERDLDEEEIQTLRHTARVFERSVARTDHFTSFRVASARNSYTIRSAIARRSVLHAAAENAPTSVVEVTPNAATEAMNAKERGIWEALQRTDPAQPTTAVGQQVYEELSAHAKRAKPSFIANLKRALQTPVAEADLATSVARGALETLIGDRLGEVGELLQGLETPTRKAVADAIETKSRRFVSAIIGSDGSGMEAAVRAVDQPYTRDIVPKRLAEFQESTRRHQLAPGDGDALLNTLRQHPPTIDPAPNRHVDLNKVMAIIQPHVSGSEIEKLDKAFALSRPLADFSSFFPASEMSFRESFDSKAFQQLAGGTEKTKEYLEKQARLLTANARSYERLKGFSKVGGVLFGIAPEGNPNPLDYRGFRWELKGGKVRFILSDDRGRELTSRWWDGCIAGQALPYAADGRPLTLTIVSCSPLLDQKVLIHAAAVDTALGYRLMELDHFVADQAWEGKLNPELTREATETRDFVEAQAALYDYALDRRSMAVNRWLLGKVKVEYRRELEKHIEGLEKKVRLAETNVAAAETSSAAQGLAQGVPALTDKSRSIVAAKPEYFDPTIVKIMLRAAATTTQSLQAFGAALDREFEKALTSNSDPEAAFRANIALLEIQPPRVSFPSGVREKPFQLKQQEFFVTEQDPIPQILDYVWQASFETAAIGAKENQPDPNPWQFPTLAGKIRAAVANAIATDKRTGAIHETATEFALLQRFFRLGFDGLLGDRFPVERFAHLARELQQAAPPLALHTIRWNTRPGRLETEVRDIIKSSLNGRISDSFSPAAKQALTELLHLLEEMADLTKTLEAAAATGNRNAAWAAFDAAREKWTSRWRAKADAIMVRRNELGTNDEARAVFAILENMLIAQDLRVALGVKADDEQCWFERASKPLPALARSP